MLSKDQFKYLNKIYKLTSKRKSAKAVELKDEIKDLKRKKEDKKIIKLKKKFLKKHKIVKHYPINILEFNRIVCKKSFSLTNNELFNKFKEHSMEDFIDKNELLNNSALYLTELGKSKVEEYKRKIFINPLIQWLALIISFIAVIVSIIGLCI